MVFAEVIQSVRMRRGERPGHRDAKEPPVDRMGLRRHVSKKRPLDALGDRQGAGPQIFGVALDQFADPLQSEHADGGLAELGHLEEGPVPIELAKVVVASSERSNALQHRQPAGR